MRLLLPRYASSKDSTGGLLFVDDDFFCYTCEDEKREVKIARETRIPAGTYIIKLRDAGGMTKRYAKRFPFHRGMLHLQDVPGFEWIYIHVGNDDDDTAGCLLVGYGASRINDENFVTRSVDAYSDLYKMIIGAMEAGEDIEIEIKDM